jgi:hypothetical protein
MTGVASWALAVVDHETVHYVGSRLAGPLERIDLRPRVLITKAVRQRG